MATEQTSAVGQTTNMSGDPIIDLNVNTMRRSQKCNIDPALNPIAEEIKQPADAEVRNRYANEALMKKKAPQLLS